MLNQDQPEQGERRMASNQYEVLNQDQPEQGERRKASNQY